MSDYVSGRQDKLKKIRKSNENNILKVNLILVITIWFVLLKFLRLSLFPLIPAGERNRRAKFLTLYSPLTLLPFVFFIFLLLFFISITNSCSQSFFSSFSFLSSFLSAALFHSSFIFMNLLCLFLLLLSLRYSSFLR